MDMKDYTRGVWDTVVYVIDLLESRPASAVVLELQEIKAKLEREAFKDFETRLKTL